MNLKTDTDAVIMLPATVALWLTTAAIHYLNYENLTPEQRLGDHQKAAINAAKNWAADAIQRERVNW